MKAFFLLQTSPQARIMAAVLATSSLFPFSHTPSRFVSMVACGDRCVIYYYSVSQVKNGALPLAYAHFIVYVLRLACDLVCMHRKTCLTYAIVVKRSVAWKCEGICDVTYESTQRILDE